VFELAKGRTNITTLATFNGTDGQTPEGAMVMDANGNLFGTTFKGGANGDGTVFEVVKGSGAITALASFNGTDGKNPVAGLTIDAAGNIFGSTTQGGASNQGALFEVAQGSNAITLLTSFSQTDGAAPLTPLIRGVNGNLFGTTSAGGPTNNGTVFELAAGATSVTTLASFDGADGSFPQGTMVLDPNGNLFGTAHLRGAVNDGVAFEIASGSGVITDLVSFNGFSGALPTGLVADSTGNLYGVTQSGSQNGTGAIFRLVPGGTAANPGVLSATVANTNLPSSEINGTILNATAVVNVADQASESGPLTVNVYASANGVIDGSSILVGTSFTNAVIKAGQPFAVPVTIVSVPLTAGNGFYTLLAQAVDPSGNTANATTGPGLQTIAPVVALSESFTRLTLPTNSLSGSPTSAAAVLTITNSGNIPSSGRITISLFAFPEGSTANGARITTVVRSPVILPGGSVQVAVPITMIPAGLNGTYQIVAQVTDHGGGQSSVATAPIFNISAPVVLLSATIDSFSPSSLSLNSTTRGTFSVTITNNGNIPARGFNIDLGLVSQDGATSARLQSYRISLQLNPGASRTLTFTFIARGLASLSPGIYFPTIAVSVLRTAFSTTSTGQTQIVLS
jgi:uncharacterized repeat protein (TIGR03803 family)